MSESTDANSEIIVDLAPRAVAMLLEQMGAKSVIAFPDRLTHGPVSADPKRHRKERLGYWRAFYESLFAGVAPDPAERVAEAIKPLEKGYLSAEQLGSAAARAAGDGGIVIWTTPTLEDRLFLWFACHALRSEGVSIEQIAIAEPQVLLPSDNPDEARYASLAGVDEEEIAAAFDELFHPELIYVDAAANLWETFASVSPRQFAVSINHTMKFFPQFVVFAEDYGNLFPVAHDARLLRTSDLNPLGLSEFDRDLFERLSVEEFRSGATVIDEDFSGKYAFLGDSVALARLRRWSLHEKGGAAYILAREAAGAAEAGADMNAQFEYRSGPRGAQLLSEGFEAGRKLPLFTIGNARLYAGKKPWVRVVEGEVWGFERFDASR